MSTSIIQPPAFERLLAEHIEATIRQAAEPIIAKAMRDIEEAMRKRVAAAALGVIERSYSVDRKAQRLPR